MLPLSLLNTCQGRPFMVELKSGETYNGIMVNCDTWMNLTLKEVIRTSANGDKFEKIPDIYIRGSMIKYIRIPDEVLEYIVDDRKQWYENNNNRNFTRQQPQGNRGGRGGRGGSGRGGGSHNDQRRGGYNKVSSDRGPRRS